MRAKKHLNANIARGMVNTHGIDTKNKNDAKSNAAIHVANLVTKCIKTDGKVELAFKSSSSTKMNTHWIMFTQDNTTKIVHKNQKVFFGLT